MRKPDRSDTLTHMFRSIKTTILIALVGLQIITAGIIISTSYVTSETAVLRQAEQLMIKTAKHTIRHTQSFLERAETALNLSQGLHQMRIFDNGNHELLERFFFKQLRVSPTLSGIYYGDTKGQFIFVSRTEGPGGTGYRTKEISSDRTGAQLTFRNAEFETVSSEIDEHDTYDPRARPWYTLASDTGGMSWTKPYIFYTSQLPGISAAAPVYADDGTLSGVIGIDMEISAISDFLANLSISKSGTAFILETNGDVIAHPDPSKIKKHIGNGEDGIRFAKINEIDDPVARAVADRISAKNGNVDFSVDQFVRVDLNNEIYNAVFAPFMIGNLDWTIAIYVPQNEFLGPITDGRVRNIAIAVSIAVIAILTGLIITRMIIAPLSEISRCADQIARGETARTKALPENFEELRNVSTAFRRMTEWLSDYKRQNSAMHGALASSAKKLERQVADLNAEILERKRAELQSQKLQNELAHVTRYSTAGEMAASLAHELNQPLTAITQYCDALLSTHAVKSLPDGEVVNYIEDIQDQAFRSGEIIRHLRQFIRKGETDSEEVDLNELITQTVRLIEPQAKENGIGITIATDPDLPLIQINRVQIAQVLVNLLRNSVDAIVSADSEKRLISINSRIRGEQTEIMVEDSGLGLTSPCDAFKPFETSKQDGMGMGLSISRSIVEAHNGRLSADMDISSGARFRILLPNRSGENVREATEAAE